MNKKPKIIVFDIETINLKADLSPILSFAWKELGSNKTSCMGLWDYPTWNKRVFDDRLLLKDIYKVFLDANVLVAHYGKGFDLKFIKSRLLLNKMKPLPQIRLLDTCLMARENFLFTSNRLKNLSDTLMLKKKKMNSGGWMTWLKVVNKDPVAIKKMVRYNKRDVVATEELYKLLSPHVNGGENAMNHNAFSKSAKPLCNECGSNKIQWRGTTFAESKIYKRYQCRSCGHWDRSRTAEKKVVK